MHNALKLAAVGAIALVLTPTIVSAQAFLNTPNRTNSPTSNHEPPCEYGMGYLPRVSAQQVRGIDDDWRVWIRPVCENSPHAPVRNMGNATQLIGTIGRNDTLEAALDDQRYLADDVVGVQLSKGNRVTLWVHPSLYR